MCMYAHSLFCPSHPANTKHLYNICTTSAQRLRRWSNIVQMLYKCFVFTGHPPRPTTSLNTALSFISFVFQCSSFTCPCTKIIHHHRACSALQSQKAVSACLQSKKISPFGFLRQYYDVQSTTPILFSTLHAGHFFIYRYSKKLHTNRNHPSLTRPIRATI